MLAGMHAYLYYWIHAKHYLSYLYNGVDAVEDSIEIIRTFLCLDFIITKTTRHSVQTLYTGKPL